MHQKKPEPLFQDPPAQKFCPVCGEVSYSKAGIHPQCAVTQADSLRRKRQKAPPKTVKKSAPVMKPWHRLCPRCRGQVHIRRKNCDCGHVFDGKRP